MDGLLFYHKKARYTFGATPLVVWLKPYMLPDILSLPIPPHLAALTPPSYISFTAHADKVRQAAAERRGKGGDLNPPPVGEGEPGEGSKDGQEEGVGDSSKGEM